MIHLMIPEHPLQNNSKRFEFFNVTNVQRHQRDLAQALVDGFVTVELVIHAKEEAYEAA